MATEITFCIEDDGSMTVEAGEKQETPEVEQGEGGQKIPVKSLDEALSAIRQLAQSAGGDQAGMEEMQQDEGMMSGFRPQR